MDLNISGTGCCSDAIETYIYIYIYIYQKDDIAFKLTYIFLSCNIMITCPCTIDPLTPHFYMVKLGFTGIYILFLIFAQKHKLWVLVRTASSSSLGGSNVYPQSMF